MSRGCKLCNGKTSCGNWHLYAIELDAEKCRSDRSFVRKYGDDAIKAYYVGKTTHTMNIVEEKGANLAAIVLLKNRN